MAARSLQSGLELGLQSMASELSDALAFGRRAAPRAGVAAMALRETSERNRKAAVSPVTEADHADNVVDAIRAAYPTAAILSEESKG